MPKGINYPHERMEHVGSSLRGHAETLRTTAGEGGGTLSADSLGHIGQGTASTISGHLGNVPGQIQQMAEREEAHGNRLTQAAQEMRGADEQSGQRMAEIESTLGGQSGHGAGGQGSASGAGSSGGAGGSGGRTTPGGADEEPEPGSRWTQPSGVPDPGAAPGGRRTRIGPKQDAAVTRSLRRENDSADILARAGYQVEQNPAVPGAKNPDYKIEGKVFDNYAPGGSNVRNIASEIQGKVDKGQTERVVLNMADSKADLEKMRKQLNDWPIQGLQEVIVIDKHGQVVPFYP